MSAGRALVLFSGGQDSTTCLAWALSQFAHVETIGFDYGQRHHVELQARQTVRDIVEEAVYKEFEAISERGGVLGAMDTMYQRGKIQEESLYYEHKKHDGSLPLVGVNTFLPREHGGEIATADIEIHQAGASALSEPSGSHERDG